MKKYNGLTKYQKAQNFRANAKYLTKDFIVPLYTGSEVEIPKQSKKRIIGRNDSRISKENNK